MRTTHQRLRQRRIAHPLRHPHQVVVVFGLGVAAHVQLGLFFRGHVRNQRLHVLQPPVGATDSTSREVGVAAPKILRRLFQHQHGSARLPGGKGGAESSVPRPHHNNVVSLRHNPSLTSYDAMPHPQTCQTTPRCKRIRHPCESRGPWRGGAWLVPSSPSPSLYPNVILRRLRDEESRRRHRPTLPPFPRRRESIPP